MNLKRAIKGGIGLIVSSFAAGSIVSMIKSNRETKELHKRSKELQAESERLIKEAKEGIAESERLNSEFEKEIERIKSEVGFDCSGAIDISTIREKFDNSKT